MASSVGPALSSSIDGSSGTPLIRRLALATALLSADIALYRLSGVHSDFGSLNVLAKAGLGRALTFVCLFAVILYTRSDIRFRAICREIEGSGVQRWPLAFNIAGLAALFGIAEVASRRLAPVYVTEACWCVAGAVVIGSALFAFLPPRIVWKLLRQSGPAGVWALVATLGLALLYQSPVYEYAWRSGAGAVTNLFAAPTFFLVQSGLQAMMPETVADPSTFSIRLRGFEGEIGWPCSGIEGVALMLAFASAWIVCLRRELNVVRALVLIPVGLALVMTANVVRIIVLVLIGGLLSARVATGGFHSHAGWIAFNGIAVGVVLVSTRVRWFLKAPEDAGVRSRNPVAVYLMPLLSILAAAMLSRAASGSFEWLYPLRVIAVCAVLWHYRTEYAKLDWRFSPISVLAGIGAFLVWIGPDLFGRGHGSTTLASDLSALPVWSRWAWIAFRTAGACVFVPIAEELAFRAFLIRRFMSSDFESIDPRVFSYSGLAISAAAFGALHGDRWVVAIVAGLIYSWTFLRRGRIGDAVIAHAVTNALVAAAVLFFDQWYLW